MSIAVNVNDPTNTGVNSTSSATGSSSLTGSNASDLQSSFLTLLVAQLKNQDPTNPMQNNELTTQLAQISTVSGIEKLNTTLGSVSGQIDNSQSLQAANLIGHGVMIPGTTILAGTSTTDGTSTTTTTPFGVELQQPADKGNYSNEQTQVLGQIVLANFANNEGLKSEGDNVWSATQSSGVALLGTAGSGNFGTLTNGALEASNVDLSKELVNMIVAQRNYQSNAQTIKTQDQILNTLVNLR
ncbi:flagellar hook-basal body complex protein [Enterobacter hormaechei]|nr:flagellar hook-basal body complex protein [Enterobacter hormaechei]